MKRFLTLALALVMVLGMAVPSLVPTVKAADAPIEILPASDSLTVNGTMETGEWGEADATSGDLAGFGTVSFWFRYDAENVYIAIQADTQHTNGITWWLELAPFQSIYLKNDELQAGYGKGNGAVSRENGLVTIEIAYPISNVTTNEFTINFKHQYAAGTNAGSLSSKTSIATVSLSLPAEEGYITLDGVMEDGEWGPAFATETFEDLGTINYWFRYDDENMYIALQLNAAHIWWIEMFSGDTRVTYFYPTSNGNVDIEKNAAAKFSTDGDILTIEAICPLSDFTETSEGYDISFICECKLNGGSSWEPVTDIGEFTLSLMPVKQDGVMEDGEWGEAFATETFEDLGTINYWFRYDDENMYIALQLDAAHIWWIEMFSGNTRVTYLYPTSNGNVDIEKNATAKFSTDDGILSIEATCPLSDFTETSEGYDVSFICECKLNGGSSWEPVTDIGEFKIPLPEVPSVDDETDTDIGPSATPTPGATDNPGMNPGLTPGAPSTLPFPAPSTPVTAASFTDVNKNAWYYEDLEYVVEAGLMNGVGNNKFAPTAELDRAMLVTVLWRLAGEPTVNVNTFDDVPYDAWYTSAVNWAAEDGIVKGYAGCFNPTDGITREQVAAILHRFADTMGYKSSDFSNRYYKTSDWAAEDVAWADANGILDIDTNMEDMTEVATRAEIAALLASFCQTFVD